MVNSPELYQLPRTFLSSRLAVGMVVFQAILGVAGFMYLENYNLLEAFYMVAITVSTVGYTEVRPLSANGQLFASIYIMLNIGIFAYVLAVFSYYVISGEAYKNLHFALIQRNIQQLKGHVIICGYGRYGREVTQHFLHHKIPFLVLERNPQVIEEIQQSEEKLLYIQADATQDEALQEAGLERAQALIAALPDDSENLFIVLTARQMNPRASIISRAADPRSQKKLKLAGANHVIMPEQIGGFYMATLVSNPGTTEFFSYLTRELEADIEFEEITFSDLPPRCHGLSIRDLQIRKETGTNIIAWRSPEGQYVVNPGPETVLEKDASFIVLGNKEQLTALRLYMKNFPK